MIFKLFLGCIQFTWPTKQVFCLYFSRILDNESFCMSLKSTFLAFKKVVQVVQIGGRGGGNLDKIQKSSYIFRETFPKSFSRESDLILTIRLHGILSFCRCKRSNRCRVGHSVFCPSAIFLDFHIQLLKLLRFLQFQNRESKKEFYNLICIFWIFRLSSIKVT